MKRYLFAVVALAALTGCSSDTPAPAAVKLEPVEVRYFVEGTATHADITIETPTGTSQQDDVLLPMMAKDDSEGLHFMAEPGTFVYIAAQNGGAAGDVTCRIEVDGKVVSENRSSGAYSIATCKGRS